LSTHLRLGLPSGSFLLACPPISYMHSSTPPFVLHALPMLNVYFVCVCAGVPRRCGIVHLAARRAPLSRSSIDPKSGYPSCSSTLEGVADIPLSHASSLSFIAILRLNK
jgi:hypothetical protein